MKEKIMPPLILMLICIVVSGVLALTYNLTYVDNTGVMTTKLQKSCEDIFGEGDYKILTKKGDDGKVIPLVFEDENAIITDEKGNVLIEIVKTGYKLDGIHVLVGINANGEVSGVSFISILETPGLGSKIKDKSFTDKFLSITSPEDVDTVDVISGATYSSKGMKMAVKSALEIYNNNKEDIING